MKKILLLCFMASLSFAQNYKSEVEKININQYNFINSFLSVRNLNLEIPENITNLYNVENGNKILISSNSEIKKGSSFDLSPDNKTILIKKYVDNILVYYLSAIYVNENFYITEFAIKDKTYINILENKTYLFKKKTNNLK